MLFNYILFFSSFMSVGTCFMYYKQNCLIISEMCLKLYFLLTNIKGKVWLE
jgi:hypothetical protein